MQFFTHENFPNLYVDLIEMVDTRFVIRRFLNEYPAGEPDDVWIECLGKDKHEKPFILAGCDPGIMRSKHGLQVLRESGCSFIYLSKDWRRMNFAELAWRLIKAWPGITKDAEKVNRQCTIEVDRYGKIDRRNLR